MMEMKPKFDIALNIIRSIYPELHKIIFYGELFGTGVYNRVKYGIELYFYGFDIFVNDHYLDFDQMCEIYKASDIFHSLVISRGNFNDLININPNFDSEIAKHFLQEHIENNMAEGVVIIPTKNYIYGNGSRSIIKHKSEKFHDIKEGNEFKQKLYKLEDNSLNEESQQFIDWMMEFNTENRMIDTKSKFLITDNKKRICYSMMVEIIDEVEQKYNVNIKTLKQKKLITNKMIENIISLFDSLD
jgi:Rnl2 family RNA ligase